MTFATKKNYSFFDQNGSEISLKWSELIQNGPETAPNLT